MKKQGSAVVWFFLSLFVSFSVIWYMSYRLGAANNYPDLREPDSTDADKSYLPTERGVFQRDDHALDYKDAPMEGAHQRDLKSYYANRAYDGAPPFIPHPIEVPISIGGKDCLKCHQNGGFVPKWKAYAPVTPHPKMLNCRQCHAARQTNELFAASDFEGVSTPQVGHNNALPGSPPVIPHQIQMRENCLSCHAGAAAPEEIRTTHPERVNCRQCHVQSDGLEAFAGGYLSEPAKSDL